MRVVCIVNDLASIVDKDVHDRLRQSITIDGPITDLKTGMEYTVQCIERRDEGLWVFIHTVLANNYPYPYPIEMFEFRDRLLPHGWCIGFERRRGSVNWKRIGFPAWVNDDHFYENLVEGNADAIALYRSNMNVNEAFPIKEIVKGARLEFLGPLLEVRARSHLTSLCALLNGSPARLSGRLLSRGDIALW